MGEVAPGMVRREFGARAPAAGCLDGSRLARERKRSIKSDIIGMFAILVLLAGACEDDKGGDPVVTPAEG
jgi:hypothetical protein